MRNAHAVPSLAECHDGRSKSARALANALARPGDSVELHPTRDAGHTAAAEESDAARTRVGGAGIFVGPRHAVIESPVSSFQKRVPAWMCGVGASLLATPRILTCEQARAHKNCGLNSTLISVMRHDGNKPPEVLVLTFRAAAENPE